jgi:hypothetical protein
VYKYFIMIHVFVPTILSAFVKASQHSTLG